jgi:hypothetical protein
VAGGALQNQMIMSIETFKRFSALTNWNTANSNGNKVSPDSSPKVIPGEQ